MGVITFLGVLPLPALRGQPLAVTATRALELWSDLAAGTTEPADLKPEQRIDVMDECLDVVVPTPDSPVGFEFTGLTVADFRAALFAAPGYGTELESLDATLRSQAVESLRVVARKRIHALKVGGEQQHCFLQRLSWIPDAWQTGGQVTAPDALMDLFETDADLELDHKRFKVEIVETVTPADPGFPTHGTDYQSQCDEDVTSWGVLWGEHRLQPQPVLEAVADYHELQITLPGFEPSFFSDHFHARNSLAHLRYTLFTDAAEQKVLLLDEVQSDWHRDLRWQQKGHPLNRRIRYPGDEVAAPLHIPSCPPVAQWLDIAVECLKEAAFTDAVDVIAWVPGAIQHALNPDLPLATAQRLYDQRLPRKLRAQLGGHALRQTHIAYPTYARSLLIQQPDTHAWRLVLSDQETPASKEVETRKEVRTLFYEQATPVLDQLPGIAVDFGDTAPRGDAPLDFGQLP
ncbi:MAG TPA: hypothetical protein VFQ88_04665 [Nevskiaceae bacterium]|nr:hypothetical protein [Nevskiaceae bacterium]